MNTFKCNKKLKIYIATELFYCLFRVTENILKYLLCFQRLLPPRKRLHDLPVLCHSLECEVILFSLEKLCHRRFTKYHTDPGPGADCIFCGSILFLVFI